MLLRVVLLSLVWPWVLTWVACGASQRPRGLAASLRVLAEPEYAVVEIDERSVGSGRVLSQRPVRLEAGLRRISVTAPGYFPHDIEVNLAAGETKLEINLRPIPQ